MVEHLDDFDAKSLDSSDHGEEHHSQDQPVFDSGCAAYVGRYRTKDRQQFHGFRSPDPGASGAVSQVSLKKSFKGGVVVANNPTWLLVVAALVRDREGRLLLQQALPGKRHAGHWEFPGGKVENSEDPRSALCREVAEELGLTLDQSAMTPAGFVDERGEGRNGAIVLILYDCSRWQGEPQSREGQAWGWFSPEEAAAMPLGALDRALLEGIAKVSTRPYVAPSKRARSSAG